MKQPPAMCERIDNLITLAELNSDPDRVEEMRHQLQVLRCQIECLREWGLNWRTKYYD